MAKPYLEPGSPDNQSGAYAKDAVPTRSSVGVPSKAPAQSGVAEESCSLSSKRTGGPRLPPSVPTQPASHPVWPPQKTAPLPFFPLLLADPAGKTAGA